MFESERKELVEKLRKKGITDENVLSAIQKIERHKFVSSAMVMNAYKDVALPIACGQTISQPYTVAFMTQELKIKPGYKILEIGTGSGYQAAILLEMGCNVFSIERNIEILNQTQKLFEKLNLRAYLKYGDGTIGIDEFAPFDGIIVTAGSPSIPKTLLKQLNIGARMVIPVGDRDSQIIKIVTKINENDFKIEDAPYFAFVPLIGREGWRD
ncbi:MAG: protein-L-isoaspartate O-methyltransferase [Chlorobiaceae bacterium]|nr:protein-L-isoaspartate O-methyltransferase [Chlorobiaceae bacterium]MBA4308907.1 protein-L-isoaspartate O-methyltransferase [Chlorobiaceae bacterium]